MRRQHLRVTYSQHFAVNQRNVTVQLAQPLQGQRGTPSNWSINVVQDKNRQQQLSPPSHRVTWHQRVQSKGEDWTMTTKRGFRR